MEGGREGGREVGREVGMYVCMYVWYVCHESKLWKSKDGVLANVGLIWPRRELALHPPCPLKRLIQSIMTCVGLKLIERELNQGVPCAMDG